MQMAVPARMTDLERGCGVDVGDEGAPRGKGQHDWELMSSLSAESKHDEGAEGATHLNNLPFTCGL